MADSRGVRPVIALLASLAAAPTGAGTCESLSRLALPATMIASAQSVPAGPFNLPQAPRPHDLPALCRVAGAIKPSADSDIQFEVWLPESGWNGKLRGAGNHGFAGSLDRESLARAVSAGYPPSRPTPAIAANPPTRAGRSGIRRR